jgi:hypothetical protein
MEPEKIKEIETRMAHFKEIEDTLTPEAKQIFLTEVNNLVLDLNKDVEDYLIKMKQIELSQA